MINSVKKILLYHSVAIQKIIPKTMTIFIDEKYTSVDLSDGLHHISFILCYMKIDSEIH